MGQLKLSTIIEEDNVTKANAEVAAKVSFSESTEFDKKGSTAPTTTKYQSPLKLSGNIGLGHEGGPPQSILIKQSSSDMLEPSHDSESRHSQPQILLYDLDDPVRPKSTT